MSEESISQEIAKEYLRDIEPMWKAFWFHMHRSARNLEEFAEGMTRINDDIFREHASGQKNDFVRWVREVIGDSVLARELSSVDSKEEAAGIIRARVDELKRIAQ
ncbi:DUF5752 family protein [Patescibacteria group bacterium]